MILRTQNGGNREVRAAPVPFGVDHIIPPPGQNLYITSSGEGVTVDSAAGLPGVFNAIRLISETTGRLPVRVYRGFQATKATAEDTWQWNLLHDRPNDERSAFDFWQDVAACVEGHGNAFLQKVKVTRGRVDALYLIDPSRVQVRRRDTTGALYYVVTRNGQYVELGTDTILHIRGMTFNGTDVGVSPITAARESLGTGLARYRTEGNLWRNNAAPPGGIKVPGNINRDKAKEVVKLFMEHHGGNNAGVPAVLSNGSDWVSFGIPLKDAEYVAAHNFGVEDVARMFNVPAELLSSGTLRQITEESSRRLLNFGLMPRLARIASALKADTDLFPENTDVYPEFYIEDFVSADALTKAQIRHLQIQDGTLLVDEARAEDGRQPLPPLPEDPSQTPGMVPQITPVGGAPNPVAAAANDPGTQNGNANGRAPAVT